MVWLCITKIWSKSKILLYGYRHFAIWPCRFIVYRKADDIYQDISEDVETRFDTSSYEWDRPLPKGKNEKVIGTMKDE